MGVDSNRLLQPKWENESPTDPRRVHVSPRIEAEMTRAAKAIVEAAFAKYEQHIAVAGETGRVAVRSTSKAQPTHPLGSAKFRADPAKPKRKPLPGKERKRGDQNGHQRHRRALLPSDQCTTVKPCRSAACWRCGGQLPCDPAEPTLHKGWELPRIVPVVNEYRLFRGHRSLVRHPHVGLTRGRGRRGSVALGSTLLPVC